jgi:hypothetical protein
MVPPRAPPSSREIACAPGLPAGKAGLRPSQCVDIGYVPTSRAWLRENRLRGAGRLTDERGDVLDLLLAELALEGRHHASTVRHALDHQVIRRFGVIEVGAHGACRTGRLQGVAADAAGRREDCLARGRVALAPRRGPGFRGSGLVSAGSAASTSWVVVTHQTVVSSAAKSATHTATNTPTRRPGNVGRRRGTTIATTSEKTMNVQATARSTTLPVVVIDARSTRGRYHGPGRDRTGDSAWCQSSSLASPVRTIATIPLRVFVGRRRHE